jgi:hypothetical protein
VKQNRLTSVRHMPEIELVVWSDSFSQQDRWWEQLVSAPVSIVENLAK